jgi:pSer/pThr/pTyr-binding forkhead associated (FHA) protein
MILARLPRRRIGFATPGIFDAVLARSTLEGSRQLATLWLRDAAPDSPAELAVRQATARLGSEAGNDAVITGDGVGRNHAELHLRNGLWFVRDLGTEGGSWVDDEPVGNEALLAPGSSLRLGRTTLIFSPHDRWEDSAVEPSTAAEASLLFVLPEHRPSIWPRVLLVAGLLILAFAVYLVARTG